MVDPVEEFGQVNIHDEPIAFDDVGLRLRHRLVSGAARPEAVAMLAECWVPQRLKPQQDCLLDHTINDGWDTLVELHSFPTSLWDWLRSSTHFIRCVVSGLSS